MGISAKLFTEIINHLDYNCLNLTDWEISRIRLLDGEENFCFDTLYIGTYDNLAADGFQYPLILTDEEHLSYLYNCMQSLLLEDCRKNSEIIDLYRKIEEISLADICQKLSSIFKYPFFLLDPLYHLIGRYPLCGFHFPSNAKLRKYLQSNDFVQEAVTDSNVLFGHPYMLFTMSSQNQIIGYLIILLTDSNYIPELLQYYIKPVLHMLSHSPALINTNISSPEEAFINQLLDNQYIDEDIIAQKKQELNFKKSEKYYLFSIYADKFSPFLLKSSLQDILGQDVYLYQNYCIAIMGFSALGSFSHTAYPKLLSFLKEHNLFAGLSNAFFDFSKLHIAFNQSVDTISLHRHFSSDSHLSLYSGVIVTHLLKIASDQGMNLLSLCYPIVLYIQKYDQENDTYYLETLYAYVSNNLSTRQTAEVLFLHRNTAYQRIRFLKEYFKIDFDDFRTIFKLHISFTIFSYLKIIDPVTTRRIMGPLR